MAKVVQVTQYIAEDNSVFLTEAECDAHDFKLKNKAEIDAASLAFVNSLKLIDRQRAAAMNQVERFLPFYIQWVEAGKPEVKQTEFDTVKAVVAPVDGEAAPAVDGAEAAAGEDMFAA